MVSLEERLRSKAQIGSICRCSFDCRSDIFESDARRLQIRLNHVDSFRSELPMLPSLYFLVSFLLRINVLYTTRAVDNFSQN